jgi:hypothetical protein
VHQPLAILISTGRRDLAGSVTEYGTLMGRPGRTTWYTLTRWLTTAGIPPAPYAESPIKNHVGANVTAPVRIVLLGDFGPETPPATAQTAFQHPHQVG